MASAIPKKPTTKPIAKPSSAITLSWKQPPAPCAIGPPTPSTPPPKKNTGGFEARALGIFFATLALPVF